MYCFTCPRSTTWDCTCWNNHPGMVNHQSTRSFISLVQDARWRMSLTRSRMETTSPFETSPRKPIKPVLVCVSWDHGDLQWIHVLWHVWKICSPSSLHCGSFFEKHVQSSVRLTFSSQLISDKIKLQKIILPVHLLALSKPFNKAACFQMYPTMDTRCIHI